MWVRRMRVHLAHRRVCTYRENRGGVGARHGVIRRGVLKHASVRAGDREGKRGIWRATRGVGTMEPERRGADRANPPPSSRACVSDLV